MPNLNKVLLMGNITREPELRYTPAGVAVVEFGVAMNRQWKTPDGEQRKETCFVDVNMWGRRGEVISEYFHKGDPIFIEGRLQLDQWEDREGQKRSKLRVVAENFEFVAQRGERRQQEQREAEKPAEEGNDKDVKVSDDEVPF